jgi:predicted nucleic acid-binding protein
MTEPAAGSLVLAIDTNVLVYAEGEGDARLCAAARRMLARVEPSGVVLPVQVLGELQRVLTRRFGRTAAVAREAVLGWADAFRTAESSWSALQAALDLSADHQVPIWDALVLAVAAENGCRLLASEDFQTGFTWRGVTVVDPFAARPHPLLRQALARRTG